MEGVHSLYIAMANITNYTTPWIMWGGNVEGPGSHIGNIKIGFEQSKCPDNYKVGKSYLLFRCYL